MPRPGWMALLKLLLFVVSLHPGPSKSLGTRITRAIFSGVLWAWLYSPPVGRCDRGREGLASRATIRKPGRETEEAQGHLIFRDWSLYPAQGWAPAMPADGQKREPLGHRGQSIRRLSRNRTRALSLQRPRQACPTPSGHSWCLHSFSRGGPRAMGETAGR